MPPAGSPRLKLLPGCVLLPVVFIIALIVARGAGRVAGARLPLPLFLFGFALLVGLNSTGLLPAALASFGADLSRWCLVTAIAALGMKTAFRELAVVGWRPVALIMAETGWLFALVLAALFLVL